MSGPKRWIDDGAPAPVRELLIAGSGEQPGEASAQRTLAALGVAGAIGAGAPGAGAAAAAAGAAKAGSTASAVLAVKWGFVGAASALAAAGIATAVFLPARSAQNSAAAPRLETRQVEVRPRSQAPTPESRAPAEPEMATLGPAPSVAPVPQEPRTAQNTAPPHLAQPRAVAGTREETSGMLDEVSIIDQARAQAAHGDPAGALATLDAYGARFKSRRFEPEALYLRMEALGKAGDLSGQRAVAERLLAAFPSSPEAERARAVLSR